MVFEPSQLPLAPLKGQWEDQEGGCSEQEKDRKGVKKEKIF